MFFRYILLFFLLTAYLYAEDFTSLPLTEENIEHEKGIENTKHNLAEYKGRLLNPNIEGEYNLALCMWCHVQNIDISFVDVEYKWAPNKLVEKFYVYGQTKKGPAIKSIAPSSMVCLSCHDGANAPNITFGETGTGITVHSHPVFVIYQKDAKYLRPYNSPLIGWEGKKHFVYDLIKDYNGRIQCASCHDPHITNPAFLRTPNRRSALCMGCHAL
ncbi:cytochrome c3 family protein [Persephonella sp.]